MTDVTPSSPTSAPACARSCSRSLGCHAARAHAGEAVGGDVTFEIDEVAERYLEATWRARLPRWAVLLRGPRPAGRGRPRARPDRRPHRRHAAGGGRPRVGLREHRRRAAGRHADHGRRSWPAWSRRSRAATCSPPSAAAAWSCGAPRGAPLPLRPRRAPSLEGLFWNTGLRGRPLLLLSRAIEELVDVSSVGGAVFELGSATYAITRVLTGQLDAYVDIGPAIIAAHPATEAEFRRVGQRPRALQLALRPGGGLAALSRGRRADDRRRRLVARRGRPLLGSDAGFQLACIVSGNETLQAELIGRRRAWHRPACRVSSATRRGGAMSDDTVHEAILYERRDGDVVQCHVCPRLCVIGPGQARHLPGPREPRRHALQPGLRPRLQRGRRPHREEAVVPLLPRHDRAVARHAGLQLHLRPLPELADRARRRGRRAAATCARCRSTSCRVLAGQQRLRRRGLDLQRADDLDRVRDRRRQGRPRARALHGDGDQRLHHAPRPSTPSRRTSTPTAST